MVNKLKETFRDKSRDNLANTLIKLGIKAEMAERGMVQEKIGDEWYTRRQGIDWQLSDNIMSYNMIEGLNRWRWKKEDCIFDISFFL